MSRLARKFCCCCFLNLNIPVSRWCGQKWTGQYWHCFIFLGTFLHTVPVMHHYTVYQNGRFYIIITDLPHTPPGLLLFSLHHFHKKLQRLMTMSLKTTKQISVNVAYSLYVSPGDMAREKKKENLISVFRDKDQFHRRISQVSECVPSSCPVLRDLWKGSRGRLSFRLCHVPGTRLLTRGSAVWNQEVEQGNALRRTRHFAYLM